MKIDFAQALVKSPKRSRQDLSKDAFVGMRTGVATPTYNTFIIPSDEVSVSMDQVCRLAPMPVPTFVDLKVRHDWFFVPLRLLYSDKVYQRLFNADSGRSNILLRASFNMNEFAANINYEGSQTGPKESVLPIPGTIWDYLGYPVVSDDNISPITDTGLRQRLLDYIDDPSDEDFFIALRNAYYTDGSVNELPRLLSEPIFCYHFIWRDWYRFTSFEPSAGGSEPYLDNGVLDYFSEANAGLENAGSTDTLLNSLESEFLRYVIDADDDTTYGDLVFRLRYPHFRPDGFMSGRFGNKPTVLIPTGVNGTIPNLREASAWQRVIDIFSIAGTRLFDRIRAVFNVTPTGFADDRVQFLARYQSYIKIGEVITTATTEEAKTGEYSGRGILIDGKYLFKRRFSEYGWLMCISSVMPSIAYNGISRQLTDVSLMDTPIPQLAEVGDDSIREWEVQFTFAGDPDSSFGPGIFAHQFRYYAYKWMPSTIHGSFRMSSMAPWVPTNPQNVALNLPKWSHAYPEAWNKIFNDTDNEEVFGDRYFFKLTFNVIANRPLPKYINYHL